MLNIQKDIIDKCQVILQMIEVVHESSDDITVYMERTDKIKTLSKSIGNLMVKFEELGTEINKEEELNKVYAAIRLFESDIPKIKEIISSGKHDLPAKAGKTTLENVEKNVMLLENKLDGCIDYIRVNLKVLNNVVIKEKVPKFSGLMGRLHGEEVIDDKQKEEMNNEAQTIIAQINESCNNVVTNLNNVVTLTNGAINYICKYFELVAKEKKDSELTTLFDVIKMKQEKVKEVLASD